MIITDLTATELSGAIRQRSLSCVDVMTAYLQHIAIQNPVYNAIVDLRDEQSLMEQAKQADKALGDGEYWGWLHGMPFAVKDLANVKGFKTCMGSLILVGNVADQDDVHIARIRDQGAIFIGKTNVPEFGLGSHTFNPVYGATKCGLDAALCAGGSSGGAASALVTHMLPVADGSDMMGSLRNPAAFNNVVGFRPSIGRVPRTPSKGMFESDMVVAGPMGRNVEDTIRLLHTMSGFDRVDPISSRDALPQPDGFRASPIHEARIAWLRDMDDYLAMDEDILPVCNSRLARLSALGAQIDAASLDFDMAQLWRAWCTLRHQTMAGMEEYLLSAAHRQQLRDEVAWEIESGLKLSVQAIKAAEKTRADWCDYLSAVFNEYDFLALPSAQVLPFDANIDWPSSIAGRRMDTYHRWMEVSIAATMAGLPVVSLPAGFSDDGRPVGLQFMGARGKDQQVLEFSIAYEKC